MLYRSVKGQLELPGIDQASKQVSPLHLQDHNVIQKCKGSVGTTKEETSSSLHFQDHEQTNTIVLVGVLPIFT